MKNSKWIASGFIMLVAFLVLCTAAGPIGIGSGLTLAFAVAAGVKNSKALKEERGKKTDRLNALLYEDKDGEKVKREQLTDEQKTEWRTLVDEIKALDADIKLAEETEAIEARSAGEYINKENEEKEKRELGNYSYVKAIRSVITKKPLEGLELEMHQEAEKEARESGIMLQGVGIPSSILNLKQPEKRDITTTAAQGGYNIQTDVVGFVEALRNNMVVTGLGATVLTGLVGNVQIPRQATAASGTWEGENDANAESSQTFEPISLTPHRVGTYTDVSKLLMMQAANISVENFVKNDLETAVRLAIDLAAINGSGSSNQPTGILNTSGIGSVAGGTNGAAPDWEDIVDLESEVAVDNADVGKLAYLTNPKVRGKLKKTALDAGSGLFVWPANSKELNGYPAAVSTQVPSNLTKGTGTSLSAIIFGDFSSLIIGQWGGLDMIVDPYTQATSSLVRIIINSWWDVGVRHAESFAAMLDAITA